MQFTTFFRPILAIFLTLLSVTTAFRNPPYCTPTGVGVCNLGWEYDWDIHKFHIWVYDRNCKQIGGKDYVGYHWEKIPTTTLPWELWVWNNEHGPNFTYGSEAYKRENCWYMQGSWPWLYAGQCAFRC